MKKIYKYLIIIGIIIILISSFYCFYKFNYNKKTPEIKYVFYFIGDGMSLPEVDLTEIYLNQVENNNKYNNQKQLSFTKFASIGLRKNQSGNNYVTDSAAASSALASGKIINNGVVNIDKSGNKLIPITYKLKKQKNMKIGIVTTVGINHATPAGFYAYSDNRLDYTKIAKQISSTDFEYFAGSNIIECNDEIIKNIEEAGYRIVDTEEEFNNISNKEKNLVITPYLNTINSLNYGMEQNKNEWGLDEYTKKGIQVLDNENGFFMMIESGMIDFAGHNNDATSTISEVIELEKAVNVALDFANKHPNETLIIVTGDHETGGLVLEDRVNYQSLKTQKLSYIALDDYCKKVIDEQLNLNEVIEYLKTNCGIDFNNLDNFYKIQEAYNKLGSNNTALRNAVILIKNNEAGINYTTSNHTGLSVPIYVYGDSNSLFNGVYNTEDFNSKLQKMLNLK